jgi:hypothetical protein
MSEMRRVVGDTPVPQASFVLQFHILDVFSQSIGVYKCPVLSNVNQEGARKSQRELRPTYARYPGHPQKPGDRW